MVYANTFNYDATSIPPEWHGWLNYINDFNPTQHDFKKPVFQVGGMAGERGCWWWWRPWR